MKNRTGEVFITKEGEKVEIVEYLNCNNCTIKFEDGTVLYNHAYGDLKKGYVKNPYRKSVHSIGYLGVGPFGAHRDSIKNKPYRCWKNILLRCYDPMSKDYGYDDCNMAPEWHNFQNFAKWFDDNYLDYMTDWHLDKDILVPGNKTYSSNTCCFVPKSLNLLFVKRIIPRTLPIGVYKKGRYFQCKIQTGGQVELKSFKTQKEAEHYYLIKKTNYIKQLAIQYKGQITNRVYETLLNYANQTTLF